MLFNLVGCNPDDHVKSHAFLMDRQGRWDLAPAYDLCHAEGSGFTSQHQLSLNGNTSGFTRDDISALADFAGLPQATDRRLLDRTLEAFAAWPALAAELQIPAPLAEHVSRTLRLRW